MRGLIFWYAAMNTGKSAKLLHYAHGYQTQGKPILLFTTKLDNRFGEGQIVSRTGLKKDAYCYNDTFDFWDFVNKVDERRKASAIFVDEAQFLTKAQVRQLAAIVDERHIDVHCYGLRTDFQGNLFEGAQYLLAWADHLISIPGVCFCGAPCSMHLRVVDGKIVTEGPQILIADSSTHHTVCRKHFMLKKIGERT